MLQEEGVLPPTKVSSQQVLSPLVLLLEALAIFGWLWFLVEALHGHTLSAGHLFPKDKPLTDFYLYKPTFERYHTEAFNHDIPGHARFAYPPTLAPVFEAFYALPHRTSFFLFCFVAVWTALLFWAKQLLLHRLRFPGGSLVFWGCMAFCYPAAFLLDRGNFEIFVWAAVLTGVFLYVRGRFTLCGLAFGLAAAFKIYPVLLLGLLLYRRSVRAFLIGLATATSCTALSLWWSGPTFLEAARGFAGGIGGFQQSYAGTLRFAEIRYDHSLFSVVKVLAVHTGRSFQQYSHTYYLVGAVFFGGLYVFRIRRGPWLNHLVFLTICMILLPPVSYLYTLVHLYVPAMLLAAGLLGTASNIRWPGACTVLCLLLLMLPIDVYPRLPILLAGQLQSVLLLFTSLLACLPYGASAAIAGQSTAAYSSSSPEGHGLEAAPVI